jgi:dihydroxy-acid dehydratase
MRWSPFAGCDKTLPGMMMAMTRLDLPAVFVYGGAALPGRWQGRDVTVLDTYEAVGAVLAGTMNKNDLHELEQACIPTLGSVSRPVHREHDGDGRRDARPRAAGHGDPACSFTRSSQSRARRGFHRNETSRGRWTEAARARHEEEPGKRLRRRRRTGGSTNAALHIPAIAHEAGIRLHARTISLASLNARRCSPT